MPDDKPPAAPVYEDKPLSHAAFLVWALGFMWLIALSVVGIAHSRQLRGDANIQFWIVVALVAAALAALATALARTPASSGRSDTARRIVVGASYAGIALFVWEATALGAGFADAPSLLVAGLLGF